MSTYPEYRAEDICQELKSIMSPDYISSSLLERINNAVGIHKGQLNREEVPYAEVRPCEEG